MIFRIIAKSQDQAEAYAERIYSFKVMPDGETVFCTDLKDSCYFARLSDIIENAEVIKLVSAPWLYKIKLEEKE